jgi:sortase B
MSARKVEDVAVGVVDRILNCVIASILILAILYAGYGLWDTWQVYRSGKVDSTLLQYKPDGSNSALGLSALQEQNSDVRAWITVNETNIDYPVVQGESNMTYINKDVYGEFSMAGSIFLDYRNDQNFSDFYSLLYGHHMEGKVMLGELPEFCDSTYFYQHRSGTLYLPEETWNISWFACVSTDAYDDRFFNPSGLSGKRERAQLLEEIKEAAVQYRDIYVTTEDRIIALSTCAEASTDERILLFGRMSRSNSEESDASDET